VQLDLRSREVSLKLVYYGPALSGKSTNLRALHARVPEALRTRMITVEDRADRTILFDLMPVAPAPTSVALRVKLYTIAGAVMHHATRRVVLQGVDGVAFVADSRLSAAAANAESFVDLKQHLRDAGRDIRALPLVIQFNKRDLSEIRTDDELLALANRGSEPVLRAVASRGEGVAETFVCLLGAVLRRLESSGELERAARQSAAELLEATLSRLALPSDCGAAKIGGGR
jgi:signal recognition particle receptor subunit beta